MEDIEKKDQPGETYEPQKKGESEKNVSIGPKTNVREKGNLEKKAHYLG